MAGEATYFYGYCTWYVAHTLAWVRGGWGDAYQWAERAARDGFALTPHPVAGSVVVYGPGHGYSPWGHVAIVQAVFPTGQFLVSETDAVAWNVASQRVSGTYGVTAFILPPGIAPPFQVSGSFGRTNPPLLLTSAAWSRLTDAWDRIRSAASDSLALAAARLRGLT